jgi:hypothetical protein
MTSLDLKKLESELALLQKKKYSNLKFELEENKGVTGEFDRLNLVLECAELFPSYYLESCLC